MRGDMRGDGEYASSAPVIAGSATNILTPSSEQTPMPDLLSTRLADIPDTATRGQAYGGRGKRDTVSRRRVRVLMGAGRCSASTVPRRCRPSLPTLEPGLFPLHVDHSRRRPMRGRLQDSRLLCRGVWFLGKYISFFRLLAAWPASRPFPFSSPPTGTLTSPHSVPTMPVPETASAGARKLDCSFCQKGFSKAEHLRVHVLQPDRTVNH